MAEKDQNDPLAAEWARAAIIEMVLGEDGRTVGPTVAGIISSAFADDHLIAWERSVNSAGVPVRRYVARSAWEVDPAAPADHHKVVGVLRRVLEEIHRVDDSAGVVL